MLSLRVGEKNFKSAKGADACRQSGEELRRPSGGALDTGPVLRVFLRSSVLVCAAFSLLGLSSSCDPPGRPGQDVSQAENRASTTDFQTLFAQNCAGCHGAEGRNGPARILNDATYLAVLPKDTLRQILVNGRLAYGMPAWAQSQGGPLSDKQIDALVNGIYSTWGQSKTLTDAPSYASTAAGDAVHGKKLFVRNCYGCHAKGGLVGPVTEASYLQLVSNQMLRTSIIVGRPDLGMMDYRLLNAGHPLTDQDVTDLVAYLVSLRPPEGNVQRPDVNGTGQNGAGPGGDMAKGNEGSGHGPASPRQRENEGNKGKGSSSQGGVK